MSFRLLPKDVRFFDLFVEDGENLHAAATRLREMLDQFDDLDRRIAEIQALEKRGDEIDRELNRRLEDAFVTRDHAVSGDGPYYHAIAGLLADGEGFVAPEPFQQTGASVPYAAHPPAWPVVLMLYALAGFRSVHEQQVLAALVGTGTIVLVGLAGRRIAGDRAGLVAAVLAAAYPFFWRYEREVMSETLALAEAGPEGPAALTVDQASEWRARDMIGAMVQGTASLYALDALGSGAKTARTLATGIDPDAGALVRLAPSRLVWWHGWSSGSASVG